MRARTARVLTALAVAGLGCTTTTAAASPPPTALSTPTVRAAGEPLAPGTTVITRTTSADDQAPRELVAVSRDGTERVLGTGMAHGRENVWDISADGRYVVTESISDRVMLIATVWDVVTGQTTRFEQYSGWDPQLLQLGGIGLVVSAGAYTWSSTFDGKKGAGYQLPSGLYDVSADGSTIYPETWGSPDMPAVDARTGAVTDAWTKPAAYQGENATCVINRRWSATRAGMDCWHESPGGATQTGQSYALDPGGIVRELSPQGLFALPTSTGPQGAWRYDPTTGCTQVGTRDGASFTPAPGQPMDCAGPQRHGQVVLGAEGHTVYVKDVVTDPETYEQTVSVKTYDTVTNQMSTIVPPGSDAKGAVRSVRTLDGHT